MANNTMFERKTLTQRNADAWAHLQPKWREQRMREWAEMLEHRVRQLDPDYEAFHWGRRDAADVVDAAGQRVCVIYTQPV